MPYKFLIGNDNDFIIRGFRNSRVKPIESSYLNAATTNTWAIHTAADQGGSLVGSGDMEYIAASNGDYVGGANDDLVLIHGTEYWVTVILVQDGIKLKINERFTAYRRTGLSPTT